MKCNARISVRIALPLLVLAGCGQIVLPSSPWHKKVHWKAEEYFTDPQVIALCKAIEANDIAEIDRLVAAGADVNAQGKGKMTPLLWAYPDNKLDRFKRLLEHGADPNVVVESDFGARGWLSPGTSVTHLACKSSFPGYFEAVFAHGGDPNLVQQTKTLGRGDTPLFTTIMAPVANKVERIQMLIDKGANINYFSPGGDTAMMRATGSRQFDIVLMLLEAGADFRVVPNDFANTRLAHAMLVRKTHIDTAHWDPQNKKDYEAVVQWLEEHGESFAKAQKDLDRWSKWSYDNGDHQRFMAAEVAARKEREKLIEQIRAERKQHEK